MDRALPRSEVMNAASPTLPVQRAGELSAVPAQLPWLIEHLWSDQAVGILGGEPKCCKSFLALDLALAVASGTPCLRRYVVRRPGPVLFFPAEDSLAIVRQRLDGLALAAGVALAPLPLHVITAPALRLDLASDRQRLTQTVAALHPVVLILDPLIRLHHIDENDASQVAPLLGYLRQLQRQFQLAIVVVHHAKKDGAGLRPGQALRGSSELHGWGDSNLYLRRQREQLILIAEHRAAAPVEPIPLQLRQSGGALALALLERVSSSAGVADAALSPEARVLQALAQGQRPLSLQAIRQRCALRTATVCQTVQALCAQGRLRREAAGYRLIQPSDALHSQSAGTTPAAPSPLGQNLSQLTLPIEPVGKGNGKSALDHQHASDPSSPIYSSGG